MKPEVTSRLPFMENAPGPYTASPSCFVLRLALIMIPRLCSVKVWKFPKWITQISEKVNTSCIGGALLNCGVLRYGGFVAENGSQMNFSAAVRNSGRTTRFFFSSRICNSFSPPGFIVSYKMKSTFCETSVV